MLIDLLKYIQHLSLDDIAQIAITTLGLAAIILTIRQNKWGPVAGFASQPFWIYTALTNEQKGVLLASIAYTLVWIHGIYEYFFKKHK